MANNLSIIPKDRLRVEFDGGLTVIPERPYIDLGRPYDGEDQRTVASGAQERPLRDNDFGMTGL